MSGRPPLQHSAPEADERRRVRRPPGIGELIMLKILTGVAACAFALPAVAQTTTTTTSAAQESGAYADEPASTYSVAVTAGSLGIGPEIGWRLSDHVGIRGGATFLNVNSSFDSDDIEYEGKIKLKSFGAMVDVYPFGGSFRVSGGARINRNQVGVSATPSGVVTINDRDYTAAQVGTLSGRAEPSKFSPALTLGWSGQNRRGFMVGIESGVLFQGAFKLDTFRATGTARDNATFRADLEAERRSLQNDIDKVKVYPILQFAIGYRF
jgi:phage baseplate assembly protein gpV